VYENTKFAERPKQQKQLSPTQQNIVNLTSAAAITADTVATSISGAGAIVELGLAAVDGQSPLTDAGGLAIYYGVVNPVENFVSVVGYTATVSGDVVSGNTSVQLDPFTISIGQDTLVSSVTTAAGNLLPLEGVLDSAVNVVILGYDAERAAENIPSVIELHDDDEEGWYIVIYPASQESDRDE